MSILAIEHNLHFSIYRLYFWEQAIEVRVECTEKVIG